VLSSECAIGEMSPDGHQSAKRIEVEAAECPAVSSESQVAFCCDGLDEEGKGHSRYSTGDRGQQSSRIQPDNAGCGKNEFEHAQHELRTDGRHAPNLLNGMSALSQIRYETA
jgi:hypothetical protein